MFAWLPVVSMNTSTRKTNRVKIIPGEGGGDDRGYPKWIVIIFDPNSGDRSLRARHRVQLERLTKSKDNRGIIKNNWPRKEELLLLPSLSRSWVW